jgi:hypothetical protein
MPITATFKQSETGRRFEWPFIAALCSLLPSLFECWHTEMSRPFTLSNESYRACLDCGARRRFDAHTWEMTGPYFYESPTSLYPTKPAA